MRFFESLKNPNRGRNPDWWPSQFYGGDIRISRRGLAPQEELNLSYKPSEIGKVFILILYTDQRGEQRFLELSLFENKITVVDENNNRRGEVRLNESPLKIDGSIKIRLSGSLSYYQVSIKNKKESGDGPVVYHGTVDVIPETQEGRIVDRDIRRFLDFIRNFIRNFGVNPSFGDLESFIMSGIVPKVSLEEQVDATPISSYQQKMNEVLEELRKLRDLTILTDEYKTSIKVNYKEGETLNRGNFYSLFLRVKPEKIHYVVRLIIDEFLKQRIKAIIELPSIETPSIQKLREGIRIIFDKESSQRIFEGVFQVIQRLSQSGLEAFLEEDPPLFSYPIERGIGIGEEKGLATESFETNRARILMKLYNWMKENEKLKKKPEEYWKAFWDEFTRLCLMEGINPNNPAFYIGGEPNRIEILNEIIREARKNIEL